MASATMGLCNPILYLFHIIQDHNYTPGGGKIVPRNVTLLVGDKIVPRNVTLLVGDKIVPRNVTLLVGENLCRVITLLV